MKKYVVLLLVFVLLLSGCVKDTPQYIEPESAEFAPPLCVFVYKNEDYITFTSPEGYDSYFKDVRLLPTDDTVEVTELKIGDTDYPDDYEYLSFESKIYIPQSDNYSNIVFVKNEDKNVFYPFIKQNVPKPTTVQTSELESENTIFDYNGKTYSSFYTHYGYEYYLGDSVRLNPTGDTVTVNEWITCGTGLPDDYDPFRFNGEVYLLENDIFGGEIIFVYNEAENEYHPFRCHISVPYNESDTVRDYFNKRYGEGSFDGITEVRFGQLYFTNEWFELPADIKDALLTELKSTSATSAPCGCTHYTQTDKQRELRFVLPITRFEYTLTLCPTHSTVNGQKIPKTLCDDIISCIDMKYHKKHTK